MAFQGEKDIHMVVLRDRKSNLISTCGLSRVLAAKGEESLGILRTP